MPIEPRDLAWNESTVADFRQHAGQITTGSLAGANVLLLTAQGATSGRPHVVGSNSGGPTNPAWVRNIQWNPVVTIEVGNARFEARAVVQEGQERRRLLDAHIVAIPIFARYEEMAGRALPVVTVESLE